MDKEKESGKDRPIAQRKQRYKTQSSGTIGS
jgi:hypothetical protein